MEKFTLNQKESVLEQRESEADKIEEISTDLKDAQTKLKPKGFKRLALALFLSGAVGAGTVAGYGSLRQRFTSPDDWAKKLDMALLKIPGIKEIFEQFRFSEEEKEAIRMVQERLGSKEGALLAAKIFSEEDKGYVVDEKDRETKLADLEKNGASYERVELDGKPFAEGLADLEHILPRALFANLDSIKMNQSMVQWSFDNRHSQYDKETRTMNIQKDIPLGNKNISDFLYALADANNPKNNRFLTKAERLEMACRLSLMVKSKEEVMKNNPGIKEQMGHDSHFRDSFNERYSSIEAYWAALFRDFSTQNPIGVGDSGTDYTQSLVVDFFKKIDPHFYKGPIENWVDENLVFNRKKADVINDQQVIDRWKKDMPESLKNIVYLSGKIRYNAELNKADMTKDNRQKRLKDYERETKNSFQVNYKHLKR